MHEPRARDPDRARLRGCASTDRQAGGDEGFVAEAGGRGDGLDAAPAAQGQGLPRRRRGDGRARLHPLHRPRPRQPLRRRRGRARARDRRAHLQAHQGEDLRRFVPPGSATPLSLLPYCYIIASRRPICSIRWAR